MLGGTPELIAEHPAAFDRAGASGVDLLAYRASEAEPLDLVRAARAATAGRLVVAGSVTSARQVTDLARAGADAFTIGQAALSGTSSPRKGTLRAQLRDVLAAASAASATVPTA